MSFLIDTNVISELVRKKPNANVVKWFGKLDNDLIYISVLTLGEIRKGIATMQDKNHKQKLLIWLEQSIPEWFGSRILSINTEVANKWGKLLAELKNPPSAIDSLIAATALHYDLIMVTSNEKDFKFPGLEVINPW